MRIDLQTIPKFCINLKSRPDRLEQFKKEIPYLFPENKEFELFEGIVHTIGRNASMRGCAESHLGIIRIAKERGYPFVLLFEDDLHFQAKEKTLEYAQAAFDCVPDDFDIAFMGLYQGSNLIKVNDYWSRVGYFSSTHAYVVSAKAYDYILTNYEKSRHIDRWYAVSPLSTIVVHKMFAIQHPGYSDNVQQFTDYSYMLEKSGLVLLK
jgi:GR25 family glycosyltransferase involved in LPS biosynthesis